MDVEKLSCVYIFEEVCQMDRVIISAAITHIRNAREEIEKLPKHRMNQQTRMEIENVCHQLDHSISRCQNLFGPASTQDR